jgi:ferredoxin--NADP+ reductase
MLADLAELKGVGDDHRDPSRVDAFLRGRGVGVVTYRDWRAFDAHERAAGAAQDRPRVKLTTVPEMLEIIHRAR